MDETLMSVKNDAVELNPPQQETPSAASQVANVSSASSNGPLCRICKDAGKEEELVTPCHCSGSIAYVHVSCLENWLTIGSKTQCEVCKFTYDTVTQQLPFSYWVCNPGSLHECGPFWIGIILLLFTMFAGLLVFLCFYVSQNYSFKENMQGLFVTYFLLFVIYLLFYCVLIHLFFRRVQLWMESHHVIRLIRGEREINV